MDQDLVLYHGTLDIHVHSILLAVDVTRGSHLKDFGRGFYTTTGKIKAERWANTKALTGPGAAAVIRFTVSRNEVARLDCLFFARGDPGAVDFWSFVQHCRTTAGDHNRAQTQWYDVVAGPVTGTWKRQTVIPDIDQISFHSRAAAAALNKGGKAQVL